MKKNILGIIFAIIALVFIIIGLVGSWYNIHMETSLSGFNSVTDSDVFLTKMEASYDHGTGTPTKQSIDLDTVRKQYESAGMDTSFLDGITIAFYLTIIALVFAILTLVFGIISISLPKFQMLSGILAILILLFAILGPLLFMIGFYSFIEQQSKLYTVTGDVEGMGFWFSRSGEGFEMSMGPGYAWYLMFVAAIFGLIAAIMFFIKDKEPIPIQSPLQAPMQQAMPPAYPPQQ